MVQNTHALPQIAAGVPAGLAGHLVPDLMTDLVRDPSRRGSSQSATGEFVSLTTFKRLVFESAGERDLLMMLDVDYRTVELSTQPVRMKVFNGVRHVSYVPDIFAASIFGERVYWQVKTGEMLARDPHLRGRINSIEQEAQRRGAVHRVCPREALIAGNRLRNARWIHASASALVFDDARQVHALLGQFRSPCRLGELRAAGLSARLRNCLLGLVGHRELAIDLAAQIDDDLEVYW